MRPAGVSSKMYCQAFHHRPLGIQSCVGGREKRSARQISCCRQERKNWSKGSVFTAKGRYPWRITVSRNYLKKGRESKVTICATTTELFRAKQTKAGCEELSGPYP